MLYYLTARGWQLKRDMPHFEIGHEIDLRDVLSMGPLEAGTLRALGAVFLVALAAEFWLGRYEMLLSDHGNLMVGVDYVQQNLGLPLQTAKAGFAILAAMLILLRRPKLALACAAIIVVDWVLPPLVSSLYVRPNELTLEKPSSNGISKRLVRPMVWIIARATSIFKRIKKGASILPRTRICSTTSACGIGARSMTRWDKASRCVLIPTPIPTWIAIRSTASCVRRCWPRASSI